jgi:hypothetical protein
VGSFSQSRRSNTIQLIGVAYYGKIEVVSFVIDFCKILPLVSTLR